MSAQSTYLARLEWRAGRHADVPALIDDAGSVSFGELHDTALQVAGGLLGAGCQPGDRVAVAMKPSAAYVAVVLGAMSAGLVVAPLNTRLTSGEVRRYLDTIDAGIVVSDSHCEPLASGCDRASVVLEHSDRSGSLASRLAGIIENSEAARSGPNAQSPAIIFPTGGTTGEPKGAVYTHERLWLFANSVWQSRDYSAEDPAGRHQELYFSPFFHISLCTGLLTTLFGGGTVRIMSEFDAGVALRHIADGASQLMGAPTMFAALRNHPDFRRTQRDGVRLVLFGATNATPEFVQQIRADYPNARLRYGYGATEYGPVIAIPGSDLLNGRLDGIGYPLPDVEAAVVDEHGRPVAPGVIGEIRVRCPWQSIGYWGRPQETVETFTEQGILLGDLASVGADGWFTMMGRSKEMIITGGENVFPAEVENVLHGHPGVSEICVYGVPDDFWGERVEAAVVLNHGCDLDLAVLRDYAADSVAGYKMPKVLRILDALPLTSNNKPDRRALRAMAEG